MVTKEKIARINYLARKAKNGGLTLKEQVEQKQLRNEYLANIRKSFTNQIKTMTIIDPDGNDVTPEKLKQLKNDK